MHPLDPYRSANLLLDRHGPEAEVMAAVRLDVAAAAGDNAGAAVWRAVLRALAELRREVPDAGEVQH